VLLDPPATEVFDLVVLGTQRSEVGPDGGSPLVVVARVILLGGMCPAAATHERAGAVADLGVPPQRRPW
jgi:hypothetical protein